MTRLTLKTICALLLFAAATPLAAQEKTYDPLAIDQDFESETLDLVIHDEKREREIPVLIYLPKTEKKAPVILFSHGLGGTRRAATYFGEHEAARGFVVVCLQHPGSDESVWKDKRPRERMAAMRQAASAENLFLRCDDVKKTIDQLELWNKDEEHALSGRLDLDKIAMTGHSFGAVTTQWTTGQSAGLPSRYRDDRIKAAIIFSPSAPRVGSSEKAFAAVKVPWLLMTGTKDVSPINDTSVEDRLAVFEALPRGPHYELLLDEAEHAVFTDGRAFGKKRKPHHHPAILALATAFLEGRMLDNEAALTWLDGTGPTKVLEEKDRWRSKMKESREEAPTR